MEKFLLGGYTKRENKGISSVELNTETEKLENLKLEVEIASPTYLTKVGDFFFSIEKEDNWAGIALFQQTDQRFEKVANAMTEGVNPPCYVSYDKKRQLVFNANYHGGFFEVIKITDNGLELIDAIEHTGHSVHDNQKSAHVHYVQVDRKGDYLLVCDLGIDEVLTYQFNTDDTVELYATHKTPAGFGPRHLVEHPTLPIVYIVGELSSQIQVCQYKNGKFEEKQLISMIPDDHQTFNGAAAIRISSDGKFVYASNRGHDSIVVYKVLEDGQLELIEFVKTTGKTPRDFNFNKSEDFIVVGHQDDDVLALFKRDAQTGKLTLVDNTQKAFECVCVENF